jgi:inorganic pyrophosphatase
MPNLAKLPTWADKSCVYAVVETPRGSRAKLDAATYPGLILRCQPIGILEILQTKKGKQERNDRVFVVPEGSPFEADLTHIRRLPERAMKELERFFEATNALENKKLEFLGWQGPSRAVAAIKKYAR